MRRRAGRGPQPINLGLQAAALRRRYPDGDTTLNGGRLLTWRGTLTPTDASADYEVVLIYAPGLYNRGVDPIVYVVSPRLHSWRGEPLPHVYPLNRLCLHLSDEWTPARHVANTLMPWATTWLFFYEVWTATGEWYSKGEHPRGGAQSPRRRTTPGRGKPAPRAVRTVQKDSYVDLLRAGLAQAYGSKADMGELLANTERPLVVG